MTRIGWEPAGPLAKPQPKPKRRGHASPVTPELRADVLARDEYRCVAPKVCGCIASQNCEGRLTLDHVKDQPRLGKRAPSDRAHLATVCDRHHLGTGWATAHRPELREYPDGGTMRFFTSGLVSKWGFSDGDLLDDLLYDLENAEGVTVNPHALLVAVVRQHVIPALNQRVEIEVIGTIHNPVRAIEVDGRDVRGMHYEPEAMSPLTPEVVEVEDESIRSLARQMADIREGSATPAMPTRCQVCGGPHLSADVHSFEELRAWEQEREDRKRRAAKGRRLPRPRHGWVARACEWHGLDRFFPGRAGGTDG